MPAEDYFDALNDRLAGDSYCDRESTEDECNEAIALGAEEEESCTHEWPNGDVASRFDIAACWVTCAICGTKLFDLNPQLPSVLREKRQ